MSWFSAIARLLKMLAIIGIVAAVAGCSGFKPVYGDGSLASGVSFYYPDPGSRLDQIIYSELRLRLGPASPQDGAYSVSVSTSASGRGITKTAVVKPAKTLEMVVTASIIVVDPAGKVIFAGNRSTSALYESVGQVLADTEAQTEAAERGAKALADIVRLAVRGAISSNR